VRVRAHHPTYWAKGGRLDVEVDDVELAGEGVLLARRQALIEKLTAEGLTDRDGFPALPRFPRAVGVIAGRGADAMPDVLQGLRERFPAVPVFTICCLVQGAGAPPQLIDSLGRLDAHPLVDVIVVARGGGSVADLAAFDDEGLCRAIRAVDTPVICAIGHTGNRPVCYEITHHAHLPRHAAEMAVCHRRELLRDVDDAAETMARAVEALCRTREEFDLRAASPSRNVARTRVGTDHRASRPSESSRRATLTN
jgi:exodeoxyribonuclease VII large subunit